jgi:hypothetical protein
MLRNYITITSMMASAARYARRAVPLLAAIAGGCGQVNAMMPVDGAVDDVPQIDAPLGTMDNPARTCAELRVEAQQSGVYWLRSADAMAPPVEVYCEQQLNGGGWAMVVNSVHQADGTTTAFWQRRYADRLRRFGRPAPDQNYYDGSLYLIGREYMDIFVDLQGTTKVAAIMTATGINPATMQFTMPAFVSGNQSVYTAEFASGWSAQDFDGDTSTTSNCALTYSTVAQHYAACWNYNLGADGDAPPLDGGVGPHVNGALLTSLGLALQPSGGSYSQVQRIARFTRW